ncbi:GAF domain-containing protein [Streptomyces sp. RB6PN25]|uniref:GAF domain-containing protein n=1 Tax=Streptomyces humicola TaxID=2953240 RepID=A0ABT1PNA9_9ACTN|nr:GAF domain-containing protein [Streptomyces humicola]MCQ4079157.1 GAF domain-containing protein [Streptomyces humicola]
MTTYDPLTGHHLLTPVDQEAPRRVARLRELGLGEKPDVEFDVFAADLARTAGDLAGIAGAPYAMVNFISEERQYFAGLYVPSAGPAHAGLDTPGAQETGVSRVMSRDHGYCPHVVVRRKALVLDDVCDYPRFAGNPVVDEIGIRSYLGAPLIDHTGTTLGTICVVDTEPREWGRPGLELIKARADELVRLIHRREGYRD